MSARILIVDDNPLNIKLLAARLSREYYIVETAADGFQALEAVRHNIPDIILLDVMMPGMDGFEVCQKLKADAATRHVPVVMVTAMDLPSDRVQGLLAGADDFLSKPINEVALLARVRSLLRLKFMMDEWRLRERAAAQFGSPDPTPEQDVSQIAGARLLYMTDDEIEQQKFATLLAPENVTVDLARTQAEAKDLLRNGTYEALLIALHVSDDQGLQLIADIRSIENLRHLPIVMVAEDIDIVKVAKALELGASDYIYRPIDNNELLARLKTQIRQTRTYQRLRENYERSLAMALTDPLTSAFNRRYLDLHLPRLLDRARMGERPLSVLYVDLDHFKKVNDTHGHAAGDALLRGLVKSLNNNLRSFDMVARLGGEEFAVIMPETDLETATMIGNRLCQTIAEQSFVMGEGLEGRATVSIGVASLQPQDTDIASTLKRADEALYRAKQNGRNRVEIAQ